MNEDNQHEELIQNFIEENKFLELNEVQKKVFNPLMNGESLFVLAQTGSGKTLAYSLPLCLKLKAEEKKMNKRIDAPRAVILVPTRELIIQVTETIKTITHHVKLSVRNLADHSHKERVKADIIVTTPGLLFKFQQTKQINLEDITIAVIDEFDQLLDPSFRGDMNFLFQKMPIEKMQISLFSATYEKSSQDDVKRWFGENRLKEITFLDVQKHQITVDTFNISLAEHEKELMLLSFINKYGHGRGIIFVNKKSDVSGLFNYLTENAKGRGLYHVHGDMDHKSRKAAIKNFRQSKGILIATDIAARGLHVAGLEWVLNYDLPFEAVYYLHRAGRCGREGKNGTVYNFVIPKDKGLIKRINEILTTQTAMKISPIETPKLSTKNKKKVSTEKVKHKRKTAKRTPRFARSRKK